MSGNWSDSWMKVIPRPSLQDALPRPGPFEAKPTVWTLKGFPWRTRRRKPDPERDELRDLLRRRRQLVNQRVQELNRLDKGITKGSRASTKRHIAWLDDEIARVDEEYKKVQSSSELSRRAALYQSVQGVGILTAAILAADLPELGEGDGKCLTSLVGLAPWSRDSGRKRGYRAIRGGRGAVRRALYMAALSLIRSKNSALARFYNQLKKRGKPGKVAP